MLRITAYADRLENDLDDLDWHEGIKALQRNWIGRSQGAEVDFFIGSESDFEGWKTARRTAGFPRRPGPESLRIYTTRPDTLYGATYMVIAPEHPFVKRLTTPEHAATVQAYCDAAAHKSDRDRTELAKEKTGVFIGAHAINPINNALMPIWVADYVLSSYGTGAIMAVPAHDERDFEFAQQFDIPIQTVVNPGTSVSETDVETILAGKQVFCGTGLAVNSGPYDGLSTDEFKQKIAGDLADSGLGRNAVNYKLRDWLFSRQRFWENHFLFCTNWITTEKQLAAYNRLVPMSCPLIYHIWMTFNHMGGLNHRWIKRLMNGFTRSSMANDSNARPIPCLSGQVPVGIT